MTLLLICLAGLLAAQPDTQQSLNQSINRASQSEDYGWLRAGKNAAPQGFLGELANKMHDGISAAGKSFRRWYRQFMSWLRDVLGDNSPRASDNKSLKPRTQELRWSLAILAVLLCGLIVSLVLRRPKKLAPDVSNASNSALAADILNDQILPSDVNQDEWLRLALEYLANNQTRLSARAFYLANLSYLGTQSRLSLSLSKTNKAYERELARQPRSGDLSAAFSACNRLYERAWYGMRELEEDQMELLKGEVDRLRQYA